MLSSLRSTPPRSRKSVSGHGRAASTPTCCGGWKSLMSGDRKSTRLNSSHANISYAVFCLNKKQHGRRAELETHRTVLYPLVHLGDHQIDHRNYLFLDEQMEHDRVVQPGLKLATQSLGHRL